MVSSYRIQIPQLHKPGRPPWVRGCGRDGQPPLSWFFHRFVFGWKGFEMQRCTFPRKLTAPWKLQWLEDEFSFSGSWAIFRVDIDQVGKSRVLAQSWCSMFVLPIYIYIYVYIYIHIIYIYSKYIYILYIVNIYIYIFSKYMHDLKWSWQLRQLLKRFVESQKLWKSTI